MAHTILDLRLGVCWDSNHEAATDRIAALPPCHKQLVIVAKRSVQFATKLECLSKKTTALSTVISQLVRDGIIETDHKAFRFCAEIVGESWQSPSKQIAIQVSAGI